MVTVSSADKDINEWVFKKYLDQCLHELLFPEYLWNSYGTEFITFKKSLFKEGIYTITQFTILL